MLEADALGKVAIMRLRVGHRALFMGRYGP